MSSSNTSDNGVFGNSLIDDATLVKPLTESPNPLDIKPAESNTQNYDPFAPLNKATDSNTVTQLPVAKPLEQPAVFNQSNTFPVVTQPTITNNNTTTDVLTGNKQNTALLNTASNDPLIGNSNSLLKTASTTTSSNTTNIPNFAIKSEGTVTVNGSSDFDGLPSDYSDDALIYAGKGFNFNGSQILPVQRDALGNPIRDGQQRQVLVDKAVAVAAGYTISSGPSSQYAGLNPPQIVPTQTINVPAYADVRDAELSKRIPAGTPTVTFNIAQNSIKNANDWNSKFPSAGTSSSPKVVRVTGGALEIPANVNINNYVITVETGDISFKGNNQNLNNVVFVANNGNIDLGNMKSTNLAAFASGSITMNGNARFTGGTTLASGSSTGSITFNGASTSINAADGVRAISQGTISFSGASNTRGHFTSAKDFTFNGSSVLYGTISAKGNVTFNGSSVVIYRQDPNLDTTPPVITASLEQDTARNNTTNTDKITSNPTTIVSVTDASSIAELFARFNNNSFDTSILPQRNASGSFRLTPRELEQINGGALPDGTHTLKIQAKDASGNTSNYEFTFTLDTTEPAPINLDLTALTDSGRSDSDNITNNTTPTITGNALAGTNVQLFNSGQVIGQATADSTGKWQITSSTLTNGSYTLTATASDIAGNTSAVSQPLQIIIDTVAPVPPSNLKLTTATDTGTSNSDGITKNTNPTITGSPEANSIVKLYKDGLIIGQATAAANGEWSVQLTNLSNGQHVFTATATDIAGNVSSPSTQYTITVDTQINPPSNLDLIATLDSGASNIDNITKATTPTITGNADVGSTVQLLNSGQQLGQAITDSDGKWSITTNTLTNGTYNLTAVATDIAGNISTPSSPLQITIDAALPSVTLTTSIDTQPLKQGAFLTGNVDGTGSSVIALQYRFDNNPTKDIPFSFTGVFNEQIDFTGISNGQHTLTIIATDTAGNTKTSIYNVTVALDKDAPIINASLQRDTAAGGATNNDKITFDPSITATVTDASEVVEMLGGFGNNLTTDVLPYRNASGVFNFDRALLDTIKGGTLPDGQHTLKLQAKDQYGNISGIFELTFTLDTTTPTPTLNLISTSDTGFSNTDKITNDNTPTITGTSEAGATVQLYNGSQLVGETTANNSGVWQITTSSLTDGVKQLSVTVTDIAGNTNTATPLGITVDTALPQLTLTTPLEQTTLKEGTKLSGNINGTGSPITALTYRFNNLSEIPVTFNAAGTFDQQLDFTGLGNGTHTLTITAIDTAGNTLTTNYNVTVNLTSNLPTTITASLVRDTAPNNTTNSDKITFDATIAGKVTNVSRVERFLGGFNNTAVANYINVLSQLDADGNFNFNRAQLETIYGGILPDGALTLRLVAVDASGNTLDTFSYTFTLDTTIAQPVFNLDAASDSGTLDDRKTKFDVVTLSGITEPGATLILEQSGATTTADNTGKYSFTSVNLVGGDNAFTVRATDIAGNTNTFSTTIYRFSAPTAINLTNNTIAENSATGTVIGELSSIDPDTGDTHSYTLIDNAGGRFKLVGNQLQVANGNLLDFETRVLEHSVIIRSTDKNGLSKDQEFTINVTNVNETPIFTSTPSSTTIEAGSTFTYNITTTDPDNGDTRALTATGLPNWLTFTDNGNGTATITGTPNSEQLGLFNITITATDAGGLKATQNIFIGSQITLREQNNFSPERKFPLVILTTPSILRFKIDPIFDNFDTDSINDAFEVALVDENGNSLVHTTAKGRDAFFNLTEGENAALGAGASYDTNTKTVSLNLTGVKALNANLIFRLVNNDSDTTTNVKITDFAITAVPANTTAPNQTAFTPEIRGGRAPNFNVLTDVSNSLVPEYGRSSFNSDTGLLYTDISIKNIGTYSVDAPVLVAIKNITNPSVILRGADGVTPDGIPYYDFTSLVASGKLNKGGETLERTLVFYNPLDVQFDYDVVVLAQLNIKPVIESKPVTEVIAGKQYKYSVLATDKNGDALNYKLLAAPEGMSISTTGLITWDTTVNNKGNQSVVVEVSDGRGGVETQVFTLSVIEAPPNRPPQFISTPVVDAYINKEYKYDADAVDPDENNPITYNLITRPDGMKVNPNTGVIEWTPPPVLNLGDTVFGRIGNSGEKDEFIFSGSKGKRIYFDPLQYSGNYSDWSFNLYSPSGIQIINAGDLRWDSNKLLTLTEDGNYRIVVEAKNGFVGNYGFSVIDIGLLPITPFDSEIKGKLTPGSEDDLFRFIGNKGQKLYFDKLASSGNMDWILYGSNNQVIASTNNYNFNDIEIELPFDGEYVLSLRGNSAFGSIVDYSFNIITPDVITQPLLLGNNNNSNTISGAISEKGEKDVYTFTASKGQRLYLDRLFSVPQSAGSIQAYLYSPTGITLINRNLADQDFGPFTLTEDGVYRLEVDGNSETTGNYSFNLLDFGNSTAIALDTDVTGKLEPGLETHTYQFIGTANQRLYFDSLMNSSSSNWFIYDSGNQLISSTSLASDLEVTLTKNDNYTLVIRGDNNSPVDYRFRIITPDTNTGSLLLGNNNNSNTISGAISEKGERDVYTFTANKGQRLYLDRLFSVPQSAGSIQAYLYSPTGITLINRNLADQDFGPFTLTEDGVYRLEVDGNSETTGNYSFNLLDFGNSTAIALDTDVTGKLEPGLETHTYQFIGTANQRLYFDSLMNSSSSNWFIYDSGNQLISSTSLASDLEVTLTKNDNYTLVIRGDNNSPVDYRFRIITPDTNTGSLLLGNNNNSNTISGAISEKGERDVYTFTANKGQRLYLDRLFSVPQSAGSIQAYLYSPTGITLINRNLADQDFGPFTLTEDGVYRLEVDGNSETTGNYSFNLLDFGNSTAIALDTDVTGKLEPGLETHTYQFIGTANQRLYFDSLMNSSSSNWFIYDSGNQLISSTSLASDLEVTLTKNDNYTLVIRGDSNSPVDYRFRIITPDTNTAPLLLGSNSTPNLISSSISSKGEQDVYIFDGTIGQRLYFDAISSIPGTVIQTGPSLVRYLNDHNIANDFELFTLLESGTYRLVVDASGENTGSYNFRVATPTQAETINLGNQINGSLPNREVRLYNINGIKGQRLQFDSLLSASGADWVLYGPGNNILSSTALGNDFQVVLPSTDTYVLALRNLSANAVNYSFLLNDITPPTLTNSGLGITYSGTSTTTPTNQTFTANAGTFIYFDTQGGSGAVSAQLLDPNNAQVFSTNASADSSSIHQLTRTGTYTLRLSGNGNYRYQIIDLETANNVSFNTTNSISLSANAATVRKFNANIGQQLFYDGISGSGVSLRVFSPSGRQLFNINAQDDRGPDNGLTISESSTYYLLLSNNQATTANLSFQLTNKPDATPLSFNSNITGNFGSNKQESDVYRFNGTAGQYLYIDNIDGNYYDWWYLYGPGGQVVVYNRQSYDSELTLPATGEYMLVMQGGGIGNTNYTFHIATPEFVTTPLTLNQITNGTITKRGENDIYTFAGAIGQQLYFDALDGTVGGLTMKLLAPSGKQIDSWGAQSNRGFEYLTLTETGTYQLIVDGNGETTGNYKFRVWDRAAATSINFDTTYTGSFDNNRLETDIYRFNGTAGQYLYIDNINGSYYETWYLYGTGGQVVTSNRQDSDTELALTATGEYMLVMQGGVSSNTNYTFHIATPEFVTTPLTLNQITNGTITKRGENDTYTFAGAIGQQLYFDALDGTVSGLTMKLLAPSGRQIDSWGAQSNRGFEYLTLTETGTYQLIVDGNGETTGNYKFRVWDRAAATSINFDTTYTGSFDNNRLETDIYRFNGTAGQYLYIDNINGSYYETWYLYGTGGQVVTSNRQDSDTELALTATGEYMLVMQGGVSSNTNYTFHIATPEFVTTPLTLNQITNGTITKRGENDTYTFAGAIGQQLYFDALDGTVSGLTMKLLAPSGRQIDSWGAQSNRGFEYLTLTETGTYQLIVDGNGETTGNYKFRVWDRAAATSINLNTTYTGSFDNNRLETDIYRFNGTAGQYLYIDNINGSYYDSWYLYSPGGKIVTSNQQNTDSELALTATGEYMLVMQGGTYGNTNYTFHIATPEFVTTPLTLNQITNGTITLRGENDTYTFNGTVGQQLYFDALNSNVPNFSVKLYSPDGQELYSARVENDRSPIPSEQLTLTQTGAYRLEINGDGDATGNYSFRLFDKADVSTLPFDTNITGDFGTNRRETDLYRFNADKGQYIYIDFQNGQSNDNWYLYGPGGQLITSNWQHNDGELALPTAGEYMLAVKGNGNAANYTLHVAFPQFITTPLTLNQTVSGTITKRGEKDTYTFNGVVGQQLYFDAIAGSTSLKARLIAPSGDVVLNRDTNSDWGAFNLKETGTYSLEIDGDNANVGNYTFILSDRATTPVITLSTPITRNLNPGSETDLYRFTGTRGQTLRFDLAATSWSGANWVLIDPSGKIIKNPAANSPDFNATLATTGLYTLAIVGNSSNPVSYSFSVADITANPVTNTANGVVQNGTLNAGQVVDYDFTATAGTLILFDGGTSDPGNWQIMSRLRNPDGTFAFTNQETRSDRDPVLLEQTGNYKLQTYGYYSSSSGGYKFNLIELPTSLKSSNLNYLEIGGVISDTVGGFNTKIYSFEGVLGQKLLFNAMNGQNVKASLYDPNGNLIFSNSSLLWSNDSSPLTLTQNGLYNLVIGNNASTNSNYSFQVLDILAAPEINYSLPRVGSLSNGQQSQFFKLQAIKDERLYFDSISSVTPGSDPQNYDWKLFSSGGNLLFDSDQRYDKEFIVPETGEYYLLIQGGPSTSKVDYNFKVNRYGDLLRDVITPGTGENASNDTNSQGLFKVRLEAKDSIGASTTQDFNIQLLPDPNNNNPIIISNPETKFGLAEKIYQYQLNSLDPDNDSLIYRLVDAPNGAFINGDTGELVWVPESNITAGSKVNFKVEVTDRKGGSDTQSFSVDIYNRLGKIQGAVFEDVNNNGYRDTTLVQGASPNVVFAIDVSGSAGSRTVDWTKTSLASFANGSYSILDMELATAIALSEQLTLLGLGNSAQIGVVLWSTQAYILDMDPTLPGTQLYTTPQADKNGNGVADIKEILNINSPGGGTDFTPGLVAASGILDSLPGNPNLIFMSDGFGGLDQTVVEQIRASGINLKAFGIGSGSNLEQLKRVDPDAVQITDVNELVDIFGGWDSRYSNEPFLENITVYLDLNNNGAIDSNEPWQLTKPDSGSSLLGESRYYYTFDNLLPGTYTVRQVVPSNYTQTSPRTGGFVDTITVNGGETFSHLFGLHKILPPPNQNPVFRSTPPTSVLTVGEKLIYQGFATDPDSTVFYDLTLAPSGMVVDRETGKLIWTPKQNQVGAFNVILRASDGYGGVALQAFSGNVLPANNDPVFTSTVPEFVVPRVGKTFRYTATAQDKEGDNLTYSLLSGAPTGVIINANTGILSWTPNSTQLGNQEFTIKVTDGKGGEALQLVSVVVGASVPNTAPDITSTPRTVVRQGNTYFYKVEASDVDGDALTYSLATKPTGMNISNDGVISWTPTAAQFGNYTVSLNVSDGTLITNQGFTLLVTNFAPNNAPTITSTPNLVTNLERTYEYNLTAVDPDNDLLLWSLDSAPEGMVIDAITGALRWQPKSTQIGEHTVLVRATDAYGAYVGQEFTLTARGTNTPPAIVSTPVTIAAQNQVYTYNVVATDVENDELTYSLGRRPVGMTIDALGKLEWKPTSSQIGSHTVEVVARDSQGATSTQTFTIEVGTTAINNAPTITSTPKFVATVGSPYSYQVIATDKDAGDTLTYQILSKPAGVDIQINPTTGLLTWENPIAGLYQIVVGAVDRGGLGAAQRFTLTARNNSNPVINSTASTTATPGSTYAYDIKAVDADGDNLTYSLDSISLGKGMTVDALGRLRWAPNTTHATQSPHQVIVTVNDGNGGSANQTINLSVARDTVAPIVRLIALSDTVNLGEDITFQARATDNVKVASLRLTVDGTPVVLDANGIVTVKASKAGTTKAVAIATDTSGNTKQETFDVLVVDPTDVEAPTVSFKLLGINDGDFVKAPTSIRATITDDGQIDYYRLLVAPVDGGEFKELWRNDNPTVINGLLVEKFDPSLLQNDSYIVRLEVADNGGKISYAEQTVDVAGDLKLGNFRLSFTDLTVPVTGIPISLTRTYDTLTSNTADDFGYGWRMEFRDTDLRTGAGKPSEEEQLLGRQKPFKDGTKVYITLPGGKREAFTFKPKMVEKIDGNSLLYFAKYFYQPEFVADNGGTSTLTVQGGFITKRLDSNVYYGFQGNPYNPADPLFGGRYTLTTKEGVKYEIDAVTGDLLTVTDTNGNKLTYTDEAITSSTGQKITFERDAMGRIKNVKDPEGTLIKYDYDTNGDLISVTDREGNVTRMEYNTQRKHYLDKIIDPLGRTGVRNEYGEDGRLKYIYDVNGKPVEMQYDPNNSKQVVLDQLGSATIYEYDERGNILTEIDALGQITKRVYNDNNNILEETFISDRSGLDGLTIKYTYDTLGNKLTEEDPLGNVTRYTYGDKSRLLTMTDSLGRATTYSYDGNGNLLTTKDAAGKVTTYDYDDKGQLKSVKDANGKFTKFDYDTRGNLRRVINALNNITEYTYNNNGDKLTEKRYVTQESGQVWELLTTWTYDNNGRVETMTDAENYTTTYEYDVLGYQTAVIDALNRRTEYKYNDRSELIETIYPDNTPNDLRDNPREIHRYDAAGRKIATIDKAGRETRFVYDKVDRLRYIVHPDNTPDDQNLSPELWDNPKTETIYYNDGLVKAQIDERGNRTEFRYDAAGRQIEIIYADKTPDDLTDNPRTKFTYDKAGHRIAETDALNHTTTYIYDDLGRLIKTEFHDKTYTTKEYDNLGRGIAMVDQEGKRTEYRYDDLGRLMEVKNALQGWTTYSYNEVGNLIYATDAEQHTTRYEYDKVGRRTATILPMNQRATQTYDAVGNLKTYTDFNGRTITYTYDPENRISQKLFVDGSSVNYTYTLTGLQDVVTMRGSNDQVTATYDYDYDVRDRQTRRTDAIGGVSRSISYTYDAASNRTSVTTASGTVNYTFDVRNRLDKVIENGVVTADYDYDAVSNLVLTTLANGTQEIRTYDDLNRLKYLENRKGNTILSSHTYTLDKAGNRKKVVENNGRTVDYTYDNLYRLTEEKITDVANGNRVYGYDYDKAGNRKTKTEIINGVTTVTEYTYDANDRLLNEKVNQQIVASRTYDDQGNTLTKTENGITTYYTWGYENRLIAAAVKDASGTTQQQMQYQYNDKGIRVKSIVNSVETRYLIDEALPVAQVLEEYSQNGTVLVKYIYGNDLISQQQNNNHTFYHIDGLGSTRVLTDARGSVVSTYNYEAFGELLNSTGSVDNKYLFAGEQYDSNLGDYYLRARYYNAETGRFTRRDDYEGSLGEPLTLHKYIYAHANPVNLIDPTGFISEDPVERSRYGQAVELVIENQYATDPDFLGDNIYFGDNTSIGCGVGKNKALCPDILNYDKNHYMEIKPFTKSGREKATNSMKRYRDSLQPTYMPNTTWKAIPNIGMGMAANTPFIYYNDEGVLFYTPRTHLYDAVIALSAVKAGKRRSQLKKWREGAEPEFIPAPAFQASPVGTTISDYILQTTAILVALVAVSSLTARYA
ncbi:YD repeat protein (plasmid) [Calothrix sp. NIES-4071]|nr:YD repeat protein [Calothrix sp. NIES-4071]